jgi:pyruvate/2-oxoglutarate dehydrogenase complex dihydrolipoamide dehydrogenase (E3) component
MLPRLLGREDPDVSRLVEARLAAEGVDIRTGHVATGFDGEGDSKRMTCRYQEEEVTIEFDDLLVALGRRANTDDYGLKELGIGITATGTIEVNEYLQTCIPTIYACGDVAGPYQFTHTASHQAWYAAVNALFGGIRRFRVDYSVIPWTTFTDPEVARVGLNETDARAQEIDYEVTSFDLGELDRSIADEATEGFVKVLTAPGKDRILGATIVGEHAGEMISEFVFAMRHNKGLNKILGTIHSYPTLAEANKYAAGAWKRAHAPQNLLRWLQRFHTWRRG